MCLIFFNILPLKIVFKKNRNKNVEQEAPQVSVDLLAEQVTNVEYWATFQNLAQAMMDQEI